ncbi:MAG: hypothetical protein CMP49_02370 [Flavobacteriales bacterium]|nr:hypothetical protein [Flavobacteriales bacterium]|tara:strand:+ start:8569 stop:9276 length:708 start_codon:yes stop_codon:yes gene_type:complete
MNLNNNTEYWGFNYTLLITLIVFLVFGLVQSLTVFLLHKFNYAIDIETVAFSYLGLISLLSSIIGSICLFTFIKVKRMDIVKYLNLTKPNRTQLFLFIISSLFLMFLMELISNNYPELFNTDFVIESYKNANSIFLLYLGVGICGPIFEELLFRGFLFKGLENSFLGGKGAVIISSILFSIVHMQYGLLVIILMIFPMAVLLGYARLKSGSLLIPIILHVVNNILACLVTHFEIY